MSTTIDERVVEMRFDNKHFEKNVETTMSTLDKLKAKLNLSGASKGLENINSAANKVDMSGISKGVEAIQVKFSALQVVGMTVLQNLTNSAMAAGNKIMRALTIDPVKTGFQEYETQINAVQTILANTSSKGTTLDQVNAALDQLNKYADKTIYNFTEMTRNIGTFTAAGIDLDTSVSAIEGIANLAAVSGSTSQQASTAMYQLSQALSSGTVKLMDWNSVVNAGMGGQVFQDALKETARLHGVAIDKMIKDEGSFRETLSEGWLSAEILTETLKKFTTTGVNEYLAEYTGLTQDAIKAMREEALATGDTSKAYKEMAKTLSKSSKLSEDQIYQLLNMSTTAEDAATKVKTFTQLIDTLKEAVQSGWTQTWELLVGDYEEAKELFTSISDTLGAIIEESASARNNMLAGTLSNSSWVEFSKQVEAAGVSIEKFQNDLIETGKSHGKVTDEMITKAGSFENSLKNGWLSSDIIVETLRKYVDGTKGAGMATEDLNKKFKEFSKVAKQVWMGDYGNGLERQKALKEAGYEYIEVQSLVNKLVAGEALTLADLSEEQLKSIGYTEDQIKAISKLAKEAANANTPLGELIEKMSKPSGRELLVETVRNILTSLTQVLGTFKKAWNEVFPDAEGETRSGLYGMIEGIHKFSESLVMTEESMDKLLRTAKGFFSLTGLFKDFSSQLLQIFLKTAKGVLGLTKTDVLGLLASLGDAIVNFRNSLFKGKQLDLEITKISEALTKAANAAALWINNLFKLPVVTESFNDLRNGIVKTFENIKSYIDTAIGRLKDFKEALDIYGGKISFENMGTIFKIFKTTVLDTIPPITSVFGEFGKTIEKIKNNISTHLTNLGYNVGEFANRVGKFMASIRDNVGFGEIFTIATGISLILVIRKVADALEALADPLKTFKKIGKSVTGVLDSFSEKIKAEIWKVKADAILSVAKSILILAAAAYILSKIDPKSLLISVAAITVLAAGILGMTKAVEKLSGTNTNIVKVSASLSATASAMLILVSALKTMEQLKTDGLLGRAGVLGVLMVALTAAMSFIGHFAPGLAKGSAVIIAFTVGIKILISALQDLEMVDSTKMGQLISNLMLIMGSLAAIMFIPGVDKAGANAIGVLGTVLALKLMINMFDEIANINTEAIKENLLAFVAVFGTFAVLMIASNKAGQYALKAGVGILAMSAAMILMISALKMMSKLTETDVDALKGALGAVITLMLMFGVLTAASYFAGKDAHKAGVMLVAVAGAMLLLTGAIVVLSHIPVDDLDKAVGAIAKLELLFALLIGSTYFAKGDVDKTITQIAITLGVLAVALGALSFIPTEKLAATTGALSIVMAMFALVIAATSQIQSATGTLVTLTVAVGILAGALFIVGQLPVERAMPAAIALSTLMLALTAAMFIIGQADAPGVKALAALVVMAAVMAGLALVLKMLDGVEVSLGTLGGLAAVMTILSVALIALGAASPIIAPLAPVLISLATAFVIFGAGCALIATSVYLIAEALAVLSNAGFKTAEDIKGSMAAIVSGIITGLVQGIIDGVKLVLKAIGDLCMSILSVFTGEFEINSPSKVFMRLGGFLIEGLIKGILALGPSLLTTLSSLPAKAIQLFKSYFGQFASSGGSFIANLLSGIKSKISGVISTFGGIPPQAINVLKTFVSKFTGVGGDMMDGLVQGIKNKISSVVEAAKGVVRSALEGAKKLLGINSPSKEFEKIGVWSDEGLIHGLLGYASKVSDAGKEVGKTALNSVSNAIAGIADAVNYDIDNQPTIRPVLDLSEVESGTRQLSAMLSRNQAISISAGMSYATGVNGQNGVNGVVSGGTISFTQINNSPKALDRIEIYRQTKNQISSMKELVNAL